MKKKLLLVGLVFAVLVVFTGCEKKEEENEEKLSGGWEIVTQGNDVAMEEAEINIFNEAAKDKKDLKPVALLGKQVVAGTNYAILCYARPITEATQEYIYMLTLYDSLDGKQEIISTAYVNLADFNK